MTRNIRLWAVALVCWGSAIAHAAERVLFKDNFDGGLSDKWQLVGLKPDDYRIRDGGLELRVQPGKLTKDAPMLKIILPFKSSGSVIASVDVTLLDDFTQPKEFAGLYLIDEDGWDFGGKKELIDGKLVFSPGKVIFSGTRAEINDGSKYTMKYSPAESDAGPLRIIVDQGYAYFQVGPSSSGSYRNFFHSAIHDEAKERGFCLTAAGPQTTPSIG